MKNNKILIMIGAVIVLSPLYSLAATVSFDAPKSVALHDQFIAHVLLDTEDKAINALSGSITLSSGLSLERVETGSSLVSIWIDQPNIAEDKKSLSFSGIIPGGFDGKHLLFDIIVNAENSSKKTIAATNLEIHAHDSSASFVQSKGVPVTISVGLSAGTSTVPLKDTLPPEDFIVSVTTDPNVFDNKPFASFATLDKQSGIDHYEAAFSYFGNPDKDDWQKVESPYQIPAGKSFEMLYIKAVDRAGNEKIAKIATAGYYLVAILFSIIILLILWALFVFSRRRGLQRASSI